jgi:predicted permease
MAIPFTTGGFGEYLRRADRPDRRDEILGRIDFVSEGYLEALGTRLLAGRTFTVSDNRPDGARVAVVNEALVQAFFPNGSAIGRGISTGGNSLEIVGVIANVADRRLDLTHRPYVYVPQAFNPFAFSMAVRTPLDPMEIAGSIRGELQRLDPGLPLANVRALDAAMADSMSARRVILGLIGAFATAALVLACLGLYAVMAYSVVTRRRELCIRMALGAARRDVMRHILGDGLRMMAVGLVLGLAGALVAGRLLTTQLYQVRSDDPLVATGSVAAIATVALVACWIPARKATRFSPMAALRDD